MRIPETVREKYEAASEWVKNTLGTTRGKAIAISGGCIIVAAIVCGVAIANFPAAAGSDQTVAKQSALNVEAGSSSKDTGAKTAASSDASAASSSSSAASSSAAAASSSTASVSQASTQGSATASPSTNQTTTTKQSGGTTTATKQSGGTTTTTKQSGGTATTTKQSGGTTTTTGGGTTTVNTADPRYANIPTSQEVKTFVSGGNTIRINLNAISCEFVLDQSSVQQYGADRFIIQVYKNGTLTSKGAGTESYVDMGSGKAYGTLSLDYYYANGRPWFSPATYTIKCYCEKSEHSVITTNRPDTIDCPSAKVTFTVWEQGFKN